MWNTEIITEIELFFKKKKNPFSIESNVVLSILSSDQRSSLNSSLIRTKWTTNHVFFFHNSFFFFGTIFLAFFTYNKWKREHSNSNSITRRKKWAITRRKKWAIQLSRKARNLLFLLLLEREGSQLHRT